MACVAAGMCDRVRHEEPALSTLSIRAFLLLRSCICKDRAVIILSRAAFHCTCKRLGLHGGYMDSYSCYQHEVSHHPVHCECCHLRMKLACSPVGMVTSLSGHPSCQDSTCLLWSMSFSVCIVCCICCGVINCDIQHMRNIFLTVNLC